jgi:predicted AAA+ superfamily ATPase
MDVPRARVAVLDGRRTRPVSRGSTAPDGHTLWGELAWQLGGEEGFRPGQADADATGTSPGKDTC